MKSFRRLLNQRQGKASKLDHDNVTYPTTPPSITAPSITAPSAAAPPSVASLFAPSTLGATLLPWSAEALWKDAYEKLKQEEPELVQSFEQASGAGSTSPDQIQSIVKSRLDRREERQWIVNIAGKPINVRENGERLIKFVLWSKDIVADALSSQPHMALAWSGITMLLPLALTPSAESDAMIEGLDHVASLLRLYDIRTRLRYGTTVDEYRIAIVQLYSHIFEYQARMVCHLGENSMTRGMHSIVHSGLWVGLVKKIDSADQYCQKHEALIKKEDERAAWEQQSAQMEKSNKIQEQILDAMRDFLSTRAADREDDRQKEILQCLAADYAAQKKVNPKRVPNTCRWFLDDPRFHQWRDSDDSSLLWLSTGPGCGKSVLSRALVDEMLLTTKMMTSTVCCFFFKDGLERRQRGEDALCGILHQIYSQNLASNLASHAYLPFKLNGPDLRSMFYPLWELLVTTARDQSAGEIICLLDALDECQPDAREQLLDQLHQFYNDSKLNGTSRPRIKFLITSRPNNDIDGKFRLLDPSVNFIEFAGDDRSDLIRQEIDLVIDHRIPEVVPRLDAASRSLLAQHLKSMEHRTYLWLHLVLKEIQLKTTCATVKRIGTLIRQLPASVAQAYENILNRSSEPKVARVILKIILAAKRPLTVNEMTVAIAIKRTTLPRSYQDLDLEPEEVRESNLRDICGFFISIHESKVSLIHQTAREFLFRSMMEGSLDNTPLIPNAKWQRSIDIIDAEHALAQVCTTLLFFHAFGKKQPWSDYHGYSYHWEDRFGRDISNYTLLEYASTRWPEHYRKSQYLYKDNDISPVQSICSVQDAYCKTWFPIFWYSEKWKNCPTMTTLVIASMFGFTSIVKQILAPLGQTLCVGTSGCADERPSWSINELVEYYGTALQAASDRGHLEVVNVLLGKDADVNAQGGFYGNALQAASYRGHLEVVNVLLGKDADVKAQGGEYGNALYAASEGGHLEVVNVLLGKDADVNAQGGEYGNALQAASYRGHLEVVNVLLGKDADVNAQGGFYGNALQAASLGGHLEVVNVLLGKDADVNAQGGFYGNALQAASEGGHLEVVNVLLGKDADVNAQGGEYGNALQAASLGGHLEVVNVLLGKDADVNAQGGFYGNALYAASLGGHLEVVNVLLGKDADVNAQGGEYGNALQAASYRGHLEVVNVLLGKDADVNAQGGFYGNALQAASLGGHLEVVNVLLGKDADVNAQGGFYGNALYAASLGGHLEVVNVLLGKDADVNAQGGEYGNALQAASYTGHLEVANVLRNCGAIELNHVPAYF